MGVEGSPLKFQQYFVTITLLFEKQQQEQEQQQQQQEIESQLHHVTR